MASTSVGSPLHSSTSPRTRPYVEYRFELDRSTERQLHDTSYEFGFNGFGAAVYARTYSRIKSDGGQEQWPDTIIRAINGCLSIRKDWYYKNGLPWDKGRWQAYGAEMAYYAIKMKWLPPGRGLWIMGTEYIYQRGAMALANCGATKMNYLSRDCAWLMDGLMTGVGVGLEARNGRIDLRKPFGIPYTFEIPDSREGWIESVERLIRSYEEGSRPVQYDYSRIRLSGTPIRGFGGISAGPDPLRRLHESMNIVLRRYVDGEITSIRLRADLANMIGCEVISGNVRRAAELCLGSMDDPEFLDLKEYEKQSASHSDGNCSDPTCRCSVGWMSNNSVVLRDRKDFLRLPEIAKRVIKRGEPGFINLVNVQKYGRIGHRQGDKADMVNPCGEIFLEDKELCILSECFPVMCVGYEEFERALEFATFYASTVTLLPTHCSATNEVIARNRRIGVSLSGTADWLEREPESLVIRWMRDGYRRIRQLNADLALEARVPASNRLTTSKPSGTLSCLVGASPGVNPPPFQTAIRRMRIAENAPQAIPLKGAGYPHEPDLYSKNTLVFEFPISYGETRPAPEVSAWEQFAQAAMFQREFADNGVSSTISFDPKTEGPLIERMLASFAPAMKSVTLLPNYEKGAYPQSPYEEITKGEYERRLAKVKPIDWSSYSGSDGNPEADKFCSSDSCQIL